MRPRILLLLVPLGLVSTGFAGDAKPDRPQRVLLLGQSPDNHAWSEHEYMAAARILADLLQDVPRLQTVVVNADEPWKEGPELLDGADGVVLFVSEGAKWLNNDPQRLAAFRRLAKRGGGLVVLHWGMGTRKAENIEPFVSLFGGCHGGPDRKYKVVDVRTRVVDPSHPVTRGVEPVDVHEEFYYTLKFPKPKGSITPLIRVPIDGDVHTVAWAWERPDGGRSFGFSGFHFHRNWGLKPYRKMTVQAILWTLQRDVPEDLSLEVDPRDVELPRPKPKSGK